jgi:putative membrane protein
MKRTLISAASVLFLFAGNAFAADQPGHESPRPGTNSETMSAVEDTTSSVVGRISAEMTTTTKGFVEAAAISDMYEVEAGKIARERGQSAGVKEFGAMMEKAHTGTTAKLKAILASNKIDTAPPAHVDDRRQGMLDNLRGSTAADFDHRYLTQQIAAHKEAQVLLRGYAKDGDNKAVRQFAAGILPDVGKHLAEAEKLDAQRRKSASSR